MNSRIKNPSNASTSSNSARLGSLALVIFSIVGLFWYCFGALDFTAFEVARVGVGLTALWLPFTGLIFALVVREIDSTLDAFAFSSIAGIALTTVVYFGCRLLDHFAGMSLYLFQVLQLLALPAQLVLLRKAIRAGWRPQLQFDWLLTALIVASLLVNARYSIAFANVSPEGDQQLITDGDQTYYAALTYELMRHVPALEQATRAGVPERAYHMLPHLTTALIATYTAQPDVLRAHLLYEYPCWHCLCCLLIFCLARRITTSIWVGYLAVLLIYISAVPFLPLGITSNKPFFYFSLYPQATSTIEPVLITSPQSYLGMLLLYGIYLGIDCIARPSLRNSRIIATLLITAILAACMLRFRIQICLPLLMGLALWFVVQWFHSKRSVYLVALTLMLFVLLGLLGEMRLPYYLPSSAQVVFGNNHIAVDFPLFRNWPGADALLEWLARYLPVESAAYEWAVQCICLPLFALSCVIGLPLLVSSIAAFCSPQVRNSCASLLFLIAWMIAASIVLSTCISTTYDSYSVGGQMLLQTGWYCLPLFAPGIWVFWQRAPRSWRRRGSLLLVAVLIAAALFTLQIMRGRSLLQMRSFAREIYVPADMHEALVHVRSKLPADAVVISNWFAGPQTALLAGIGGRRFYLDYRPQPVPTWIDDSDSDEARFERLSRVWQAVTPQELRDTLPPNVTHLIESNVRPLAIHPQGLLTPIWRSRGRTMTIYAIRREP